MKCYLCYGVLSLSLPLESGSLNHTFYNCVWGGTKKVGWRLTFWGMHWLFCTRSFGRSSAFSRHMFFWAFGRKTIERVLVAPHQQLKYMEIHEDLSNELFVIREVLLLYGCSHWFTMVTATLGKMDQTTVSISSHIFYYLPVSYVHRETTHV